MRILGKSMVVLSAFLLVMSCATKAAERNKKFEPDASVKRPQMLDHKNLKWDKAPPEWVDKEREELEAMDKYKDVYLFKFETEKAKDLEGAQLWTKNFTVASELARLITQRIKDRAAAAAVGNPTDLTTYMEQVVQSVSQAELHGIKKESDYWVQRRYFTATGDVEGDFYTVVMLYSVPRKILDTIIGNAIDGVEKPKTEEEVKARDLVNKALREAF